MELGMFWERLFSCKGFASSGGQSPSEQLDLEPPWRGQRFLPTPPLTLTGWLPRDDAFQFIIPGTSGGGRGGPHCAIG